MPRLIVLLDHVRRKDCAVSAFVFLKFKLIFTPYTRFIDAKKVFTNFSIIFATVGIREIDVQFERVDVSTPLYAKVLPKLFSEKMEKYPS